MKTLQQRIGVAIAVVIAWSFAASIPVNALRTDSVERDNSLKVCQDAAGNTKTGALDVILLLDNSKSLSSTKNGNVPTDKGNERYGAISEMLKSLGEVSGGKDGREGVGINFGVISFGDTAKAVLKLKPLTSINSDAIGKQVEEKVPGKYESQSATTDYIEALSAATTTLKSRPSNNCKFLVWFTDGQFESDETRDTAERRKQAKTLKYEVCKSKGFREQFVNEGINTFVLMLTPTADTDVRLSASYGAMQAITGATALPPDVESGIGKSFDMCGKLAETPHLGDILIASDAKEIARKIPTIANLLTNWVPVTKCPSSPTGDGISAMPAARHIEGLSFTAYEKGHELVDLSTSKIINNSDQAVNFDEYFIEDSRTRFEQKYRMNEKAEAEMNQGWSIDISNGPIGWCVQMKAYKFEISFEGEEVVQTSKDGILNKDDIQNLAYFDKSKKDRDEALSLTEAISFFGELDAALDIDPTREIYENPIDIRVKQKGVPYLSCSTFVLKAEADMPSPARISAFCDIDTKITALNNVNVKVVPDSALQNEDCNATLGLVEKPIEKSLDKKDVPTDELIHKKGVARLFLVLDAHGKSAKCVSSDSIVKFTFSSPGIDTKPIERAVEIDVVWKAKPPMWIVWLIVVSALLVIAFLNLLLLREIKKYTSRMSKSGLFALEIPINITRQRTGQLTTTTRDGSQLSSVSLNVDEQLAVKVDPDRRNAKLNGGSRSSLRVKLPSLFRPFAAPLLVLNSKKSVFYAPNFEGGNGLSSMARQAVIVHSPIPNGETCEAMVTLLIPNTGVGREQIVRDLLGSKLTNALKPAANDSDWFDSSVAQPIGAKTSDDGVVNSADSPPTPPPSDGGGLKPPKPGGH